MFSWTQHRESRGGSWNLEGRKRSCHFGRAICDSSQQLSSSLFHFSFSLRLCFSLEHRCWFRVSSRHVVRGLSQGMERGAQPNKPKKEKKNKENPIEPISYSMACTCYAHPPPHTDNTTGTGKKVDGRNKTSTRWSTVNPKTARPLRNHHRHKCNNQK